MGTEIRIKIEDFLPTFSFLLVPNSPCLVENLPLSRPSQELLHLVNFRRLTLNNRLS
jgi:hypothetical protein